MQALKTFEKHDCEKSCVQFSGYNPKMNNCQLSTVNCQLFTVGIDWLEGPPVPIPNTEVKLKTVDDSMPTCENR